MMGDRLGTSCMRLEDIITDPGSQTNNEPVLCSEMKRNYQERMKQIDLIKKIGN